MIKTKTIKTDKAEILVLGGLPKHSEQFHIDKETHSFAYRMPGMTKSKFREPLPSGKWQPLGFLKDIPEEVAKELTNGKGPYNYYLSKSEFHPCYYAVESLHSLVEANCKLRNEYKGGIEPKAYRITNALSDIQEHDKWLEEQEKVFTNPFLLKKID